MRKHLVWMLGLAIAVAAAGVASAVQVQSITGAASPSKLPKTKRVPTALTVTTALSGTPLSGANRAQIFVDDEFAIFNRGLATCTPGAISGRSTSAAKAACGSSQVGTGSASANIGGVTVPVTVTAFNGGGTLLLHSAPSIGSPVVLVGRLRSASGDFGIRLDVSIPSLAGGVGILTTFRVKLQKSYQFRGKRRSYISAKCGDANRKLNYKGTFNYADGTSQTATDTQNCTIRG